MSSLLSDQDPLRYLNAIKHLEYFPFFDRFDLRSHELVVLWEQQIPQSRVLLMLLLNDLDQTRYELFGIVTKSKRKKEKTSAG
jgi:hypothetical protein